MRTLWYKQKKIASLDQETERTHENMCSPNFVGLYYVQYTLLHIPRKLYKKELFYLILYRVKRG